MVVALGFGLLAVAWLASPDGSWPGHDRFGLFLPCGFQRWTGLPCPTCGMTRAVALTVRGRWGEALVMQPAGWLIGLGSIVACGLGAGALGTGHTWRVNWSRVPPFLAAAGAVGLLLAAWAFKITRGL